MSIHWRMIDAEEHLQPYVSPGQRQHFMAQRLARHNGRRRLYCIGPERPNVRISALIEASRCGTRPP